MVAVSCRVRQGDGAELDRAGRTVEDPDVPGRRVAGRVADERDVRLAVLVEVGDGREAVREVGVRPEGGPGSGVNGVRRVPRDELEVPVGVEIDVGDGARLLVPPSARSGCT